MQRMTDPAMHRSEVFFFDDFESGNLRKWDSCDTHQAGHPPTLTEDYNFTYQGNYALDLIALPGHSAGAKVVKWFLPGLEEVYARWYCYFPENFEPGPYLHFCGFLGGPANDPYAAFGKATTRPNGRDFFNTALDPIRQGMHALPPGVLALYTYYPDMTLDRSGQYWGNLFYSDPPYQLARGRWYCMEMMVKCNTPGRRDGTQAAWIDGKQIINVSDLRWRDTEELKVHAFWLDLYLFDSPQVNHVYFDNVALSRSYIGPIPH